MLLEDAQQNGLHCKMMVSQPRRIAASSLMKRVRSSLGMKVFYILPLFIYILFISYLFIS